MNTHTKLADRLLIKSSNPVTHLKLQKLCFYAYGACRAHDAPDVGIVVFEAWKHGPVCPPLWQRYRAQGAVPIPPPEVADAFALGTEQVLDDVLAVYGELEAWDLRNQSHLEAPWREAFLQQQTAIAEQAIISHFRDVFAPGRVRPPAYLFGAGSFALDGIPTGTYPSLHALADALRS